LFSSAEAQKLGIVLGCDVMPARKELAVSSDHAPASEIASRDIVVDGPTNPGVDVKSTLVIPFDSS
jgi:hypothetical protein